MPAAVIWMYTIDQCASLNSDPIKAIKAKMKALTPIKIPGQDISKFATHAREMKIELDKLYVYKQPLPRKYCSTSPKSQSISSEFQSSP
jgi:hypothetical protein